jgi:hypothetical protein
MAGAKSAGDLDISVSRIPFYLVPNENWMGELETQMKELNNLPFGANIHLLVPNSFVSQQFSHPHIQK